MQAVPGTELCHTSASTNGQMLLFTILSDGSSCTLLNNTNVPVAGPSQTGRQDVLSAAHQTTCSPVQTAATPSNLAVAIAEACPEPPMPKTDVSQALADEFPALNSCSWDWLDLPDLPVSGTHQHPAPLPSTPSSCIKTPPFDSQEFYDDLLRSDCEEDAIGHGGSQIDPERPAAGGQVMPTADKRSSPSPVAATQMDTPPSHHKPAAHASQAPTQSRRRTSSEAPIPQVEGVRRTVRCPLCYTAWICCHSSAPEMVLKFRLFSP